MKDSAYLAVCEGHSRKDDQARVVTVAHSPISYHVVSHYRAIVVIMVR